MRLRLLCGILCIVFFVGMMPSAFASDEDLLSEPEASDEYLLLDGEPVSEAAEAPEETAYEPEAVPEEMIPSEEPEMPEETDPEETPVPEETPEPEESPAAAEEVQLIQAEMENSAEEEITRTPTEAPVEEVFDEDVDPRMVRLGMQVDGGTKVYSNFTPRALKSGEVLRKGIDVSSWQGTINWSKVAASGVEFVFIRAAYRTVGTGALNTDSRFRDYMNGARAAGLKIGVYIFSQAITVKEAVAEADYILNLIKNYSIDLPVVFDLEHYTGGRFTNANLSKRVKTDMCLAFCNRVEAAGYTSMIYSNPSMLTSDFYPNEFGKLWLAHYTTKTSYTGHEYEYWQCTGQGGVNGISGDVDLDFWFQPGGASATPAPTSMPTATPEPTPEPTNQVFTDVGESDWYYDCVMQAYESGVVSGVSDTSFAPNNTATRGQFVTMLHRMEGEPAPAAMASFTDMTQNYYRNAISWAAENNVVSGFSETEFRPDQPITREQLVTIVYRLEGSPEVSGDLSAFSDSDSVHSYAVDAMIWAVQKGLVKGYTDGTVRPQGNAKRSEVCSILMRYVDME